MHQNKFLKGKVEKSKKWVKLLLLFWQKKKQNKNMHKTWNILHSAVLFHSSATFHWSGLMTAICPVDIVSSYHLSASAVMALDFEGLCTLLIQANVFLPMLHSILYQLSATVYFEWCCLWAVCYCLYTFCQGRQFDSYLFSCVFQHNCGEEQLCAVHIKSGTGWHSSAGVWPGNKGLGCECRWWTR